jgi:hypothetical protein
LWTMRTGTGTAIEKVKQTTQRLWQLMASERGWLTDSKGKRLIDGWQGKELIDWRREDEVDWLMARDSGWLMDSKGLRLIDGWQGIEVDLWMAKDRGWLMDGKGLRLIDGWQGIEVD